MLNIYDKSGQKINFSDIGETCLYLPILNTNEFRLTLLTFDIDSDTKINMIQPDVSIYDTQGNVNSEIILHSTSSVYFVEQYSSEGLQVNKIEITQNNEAYSLFFITESVSDNVHLANQVNSISPIPYEQDDYLLYGYDKKNNISKDSKLREMILEFPKLKPYVGSAKYTKRALSLFGVTQYSLYELRKTNFGLDANDFNLIKRDFNLTTGDYILELPVENIYETETNYKNEIFDNSITHNRVKKIISKLHEFVLPVGTRIVDVVQSTYYSAPNYLLTGSSQSEHFNIGYEQRFSLQAPSKQYLNLQTSKQFSLNNSFHVSLTINSNIWKRSLRLQLIINNQIEILDLDDFSNLLSLNDSLKLLSLRFDNFIFYVEANQLFITSEYKIVADFKILDFVNVIGNTVIQEVDLKTQSLIYVDKVLQKKADYLSAVVQFNLEIPQQIEVLEDATSRDIVQQFNLVSFLSQDVPQPLVTNLPDSSISINLLNNINLREDDFVKPYVLNNSLFDISSFRWLVKKDGVIYYDNYEIVDNEIFLNYEFKLDGFWIIELEINYFNGEVEKLVHSIEIIKPTLPIRLVLAKESNEIDLTSDGDFDTPLVSYNPLNEASISWASLELAKSINEPIYKDLENINASIDADEPLFQGAVQRQTWKIKPSNGRLIIYQNYLKTDILNAVNIIINGNSVYDGSKYIGECVVIDCSNFLVFLDQLIQYNSLFYFRTLNYDVGKTLIEGLLISQSLDIEYSISGLDGLQIEYSYYYRTERLNSPLCFTVYGIKNTQSVIIDGSILNFTFTSLTDVLDWFNLNKIMQVKPVYKNSILVAVELVNYGISDIEIDGFYYVKENEIQNLLTTNLQNINVVKDKIIHKGLLQLQLNHEAGIVPLNANYEWLINNNRDVRYVLNEQFPIIYLVNKGDYDINLKVTTIDGVFIESVEKELIKII